jgi:transcriptional regulator with XRE-family HTH domain
VIIGDRLRALREKKTLSQQDIEERAGLAPCSLSSIEGGRTLPPVETLEKIARALEVPLHQLFYDGEAPPSLPNLPNRPTSDEIACGSPPRHLKRLSLRNCQ